MSQIKTYTDRMTGETLQAHKMVSAFRNRSGYAVAGSPVIFVPKRAFERQFVEVAQ